MKPVQANFLQKAESQADNQIGCCGRYCIGPIWSCVTAIVSFFSKILCSLCTCCSNSEAPQLPGRVDSSNIKLKPIHQDQYADLQKQLNHQIKNFSDRQQKILITHFDELLKVLSQFEYEYCKSRDTSTLELLVLTDMDPSREGKNVYLSIVPCSPNAFNFLKELVEKRYGTLEESRAPWAVNKQKFVFDYRFWITFSR